MNSKTVIAQSGVIFGTSGARGLVSDLSTDVCRAFTLAFVSSIKDNFTFDTVAIAIDNRPSSYNIARACAAALKQFNLSVIFYGVIPTPALAYKAMLDRVPAIMVTGSHIPFDRNGLKFYRPDGEITKSEEKMIISSQVTFSSLAVELPQLVVDPSARQVYMQRYQSFFDNAALKGKRIGIYEHSSAGRDIYKNLFELLGAEVISLGRSNEFVPIDTEAVSEEDKYRARKWSREHGLDAIFSTDGDGDRPLLADETGSWLRGDVLGLQCSQLLGIDALSVPISCNTSIEKTNWFKKIVRTKIGSPYVISEFPILSEDFRKVAGFEANGGYLLGSDVELNGRKIKALPTRDALLPALVLLVQSEEISKQVAKLPKRFTASDRLKNFTGGILLEELRRDPSKFLDYLGYYGDFKLDETDGIRISLASGDIVHLRQSGNAPELRCYVESSDEDNALRIINKSFDWINNGIS